MNAPGRALVAQIDSLAVPPGMLAIWGLGQSGFILKGGQTVAYLDPVSSSAKTGRPSGGRSLDLTQPAGEKPARRDTESQLS